MQYELRTQVIEPIRKTFDHLVARYGDKPASRYEEGTIDIQAKENFHFRPTWDPTKEIYDESFSVFRLTDPYSFTDPRQYYYAPYVTARAAAFDAFGATLDYLEQREMLSRLPAEWRSVIGSLMVPLRHFESGAQMISCEAARFGFGTSITQCAAYAGFDRVGNAQLLSRIGIALAGGGAELLTEAKEGWLADPALQGLRRRIEELMVERDWGKGLIGLDIADQLVYGLMYQHLDEAALMGAAGPYSLLAQHLGGWFAEQRRWLDALYAAWRNDPELGEANRALLADVIGTSLDAAFDAVLPFAAKLDDLVDADCRTALDRIADEIQGGL